MPGNPSFDHLSLLAEMPNTVPVYVGLGIVSFLLLLRVLLAGADTTGGFIRRNPIVLVPPLLAMNLVRLLYHLPVISASTPVFHFLNLTISLSVPFMVGLVSQPVGVWGLVYLTHHACENCFAPPSLGQLFRFATAYWIAVVSILASVVVLGWLWNGVSEAGLILWGIAWFVFNIATCVWYAAMVGDTPGLFSSFWESVRFAAQRWRLLFFRVAMPLTFSGFVVWYDLVVNEFHLPPLPGAPAAPSGHVLGSFSSSGISGGYDRHRYNGWQVNAQWVLAGSSSNDWLSTVAEKAGETPSPIGSYGVQTLTLLFTCYFIVGYSLVYLRNPPTAPPDPRVGFEVLPASEDTLPVIEQD